MGQRKYLVDLSGYRPGRSFVKRGEIKLRPSPIYKGLYVGTIIGPETGTFCMTTGVELHHLAPNTNTGKYRHDDLLLHIIKGKGYSIIGDTKYDWERGDSVYIGPGVWYQHFNPYSEPANMLAIRITPLINLVKPMPIEVTEEGDFVQLEDKEYDPPFVGEPEKPGGSRENFFGAADAWRSGQRETETKEVQEGRVIYRARDVHWDYSQHRGELNAMMVYPGFGFNSRYPVQIGLQAMAPGGYNEMHRHMEAIVYITRGKGTVIYNGESVDVEEGDCCFVHYADEHQFRARKDSKELFIQMRILIRDWLDTQFPFPWFEEEDVDVPEFEKNYTPKLPW